TGGRGLRFGFAKTAGQRLPEKEREDRDLQHRLRAEVSGSLLHALPAVILERAGQAWRISHTAMKALAQNALDAAVRRGVSYADVRVIEEHDRHVSTKNGKAGDVSLSSSIGLGVRVLDRGCWGFAATDDLTSEGLEAAAALA